MSIKKIVNTLAQLQEAYIEEMRLDGGDLNLKVECQYLAEQISSSYSFFYLVLKNTKEFFFIPWDEEEVKITEVKDVQLFKPDILNVESDEPYVKIFSNCENVYSGGCIYLLADDIKVFDEGLNELSLDALHELSDNYWFSNNRAEG